MEKGSYIYPIADSVDVAVVGGGPAGVMAALSAAKNGADVLLIERANYLGGNLTGGLVNSLHGYRMHHKYTAGLPMSNWDSPLMVKGLSLEVLKRLQDANGTLYPKTHYGDPSVRENFDEEIFIVVLEQMLTEAGVKILFNTFAFASVKDGNAVKGIYVANKSGPSMIEAKVVIDCTGDGDIASYSGVPFEYGRNDIHVTHGVSLQMEIGGINPDRLIDYLENRPKMTEEELKEFKNDVFELTNGGNRSPETVVRLDGTTGPFSMDGKVQTWDQIREERKAGRYLMFPENVEREWIQYIKKHPEIPKMPGTKTEKPCYPRVPKIDWFGIVRNGKIRYDQVMSGVFEMFVDQTNEEELSKAAIRMRKINMYYMDFLRTCIPGFEDAFIIKNSPMIGTRESRRCVCQYTLTASDCVEGARFEDVIAICGRACNVHNMTGERGLWYWLEPEDYYDLPYRIMVPQTVDNLLIAGRCSSVDFIALGATRGMPTCMSLGEAAGAAAAMCSKQNITPREVNISDLQALLKAQGVLLSLEK